MKRVAAATVAFGVLLSVGCAEPFSNEDLLFLKSLPRDLVIDVPDKDRLGLRPAQTGTTPPALAEYYELADATARGVNDDILGPLLGLVEEVAKYPPTTRDEDLRVWQFPTDDNIEFRVVINRVTTSTVITLTSTSTSTEIDLYYDYEVRVRVIGTEDWILVFGGRTFLHDDYAFGQTSGFMLVSLGPLSDFKDSGLIFVAYDRRFDQITLELAAQSEVDGVSLFDDPDAVYHYDQDADETGRFVFVLKQNIPETATEALETFTVYTAWQGDGAGRAEAIVFGGDLMDIGIAYFVAECWNVRFEQVYFRSNLPGTLPVGRPEACAPMFQAPLF